MHRELPEWEWMRTCATNEQCTVCCPPQKCLLMVSSTVFPLFPLKALSAPVSIFPLKPLPTPLFIPQRAWRLRPPAWAGSWWITTRLVLLVSPERGPPYFKKMKEEPHSPGCSPLFLKEVYKNTKALFDIFFLKQLGKIVFENNF